MNHFIRLLGLCLLVVASLSAQTTLTTTQVNVNPGGTGQNTFIFGQFTGGTQLVVQCSFSRAELITNAGTLNQMSSGFIPVTCTAGTAFEETVTVDGRRWSVNAHPYAVTPTGPTEVTLYGANGTQETINLTISKATWNAACLRYLGCSGSTGTANITLD